MYCTFISLFITCRVANIYNMNVLFCFTEGRRQLFLLSFRVSDQLTCAGSLSMKLKVALYIERDPHKAGTGG